MNVWRRIQAFYFRTRQTLQVWAQIYRQVVGIWRMFRSAQQPASQPNQRQPRSHTQATIKNGRTIDVDVIPPQR
ncbi:hypothetical protein [Deinococcus roseus]|uniref:Group II intron maturase-specific domain-containing protein n=1 Tax=Deinococcus roseus TaxID=392414 RepID=A0ABQ2CYX3_9DEIO|nr:hypothetical protein [Deinococcus roseus]GGJ30938.1 hypothetical protein GCM10008938_16250 [Deinococcus roseus]